MSTLERSIFDPEHKDYVNSIAYNYYGTRMATCSSDFTVKIWDTGDDGQWKCTKTWAAHRKAVWKVTWAHPEFGQTIATCSEDKSMIIWTEQMEETNPRLIASQSWNVIVKFFHDSPVTDVQFCPRFLGLKLAACTQNGYVRVYQANEPWNLIRWSDTFKYPLDVSLSSVSWSQSRLHFPTFAVGSDDATQDDVGKVTIFELNLILNVWIKVLTISDVVSPVFGLAFSPNLGFQHHVLAVASQYVYIMKLTRIKEAVRVRLVYEPDRYETTCLALLMDHHAPVYKVSWNLLGSILITFGRDSYMRTWKRNEIGVWECINVVKVTKTNLHKAIPAIPLPKKS